MLWSCAEDVIYSAGSVCGDLQKTESEECDVTSVGCVECKVAPGFACGDETCTPVCGDSQVVAGEECDPPNGVTCDSECRSGEKTEACDMTGYWLARQTDFSIDSVLSQVQTSTNWYVFQLVQSGSGFRVEAGIFCGILVTGSASAELSEAGVRGLLWKNPQDRDVPPPRPPRQGTFTAAGDACAFAMDRQYILRGGDPQLLLPADFLAKPALSTLPALPSETSPQNPTGTALTGAADEDEDGVPGIVFRISGNASGTRSVVQRDWNEYFTAEGSPIAARAIEFRAQVRFDNQENILVVSECPLVGCGILLAGSRPAPNLPGRVTFRYLGKSLEEPRVSRVITGPLKADVNTDLQTCAKVRTSLPHDPSKQ
ncbi:MAG TPA: DUF4215 domain-containing protein [Polyangiaceae bacterium]|nr:DUF4215 domain-containing protein [Polyangiaceae bacterium]